MNKQQKNKGYKQLIYIYISHVNMTQTVPDIPPLMPMHQDPLLVGPLRQSRDHIGTRPLENTLLTLSRLPSGAACYTYRITAIKQIVCMCFDRAMPLIT